MSQLRVDSIHSLAELRSLDAEWDDLWQRSDVTTPIARARLLAQWIEHFAPHALFRAWLVWDGPKLRAALPLIHARRGRILSTMGLATNHICPGGDLLFDSGDLSNEREAQAVAVALVAQLRRDRCPLLWLDRVDLAAPRWRTFLEAFQREQITVTAHSQYEIGDIVIEKDWNSQQSQWSKNFRRQLAKAQRQVEELGSLQLCVHSELSPTDVEPNLRRGFEVEDKSWKGAAGTSVLRDSGMFRFLASQAMQLAAWGQLETVFLELDGRPVAFEYAWKAKRVYHSYKTGYDAAFSRFSPGQLLIYLLLEHAHCRGGYDRFDCLGPLTEAIERWKPLRRVNGRFVAAPCGLLHRAAHGIYRRFRPGNYASAG